MSYTDKSLDTLSKVNELFGSFKAEWLRERVFDVFTEPAYFPEIASHRPCVLEGGRGSGKTSVLLGMTYEGQFAKSQITSFSIGDLPYIGCYYIVQTGTVHAFRGPELTEEKWGKLFGHFINLVLIEKCVLFLVWCTKQDKQFPALTQEHCRAITKTLNLTPADTLSTLHSTIKQALRDLGSKINNIADVGVTGLSILHQPLEVLSEAVQSLEPLRGKQIYFLIDEYENLLEYQQQVINTMIKHPGAGFTFKVGIRELGWRSRTTLNRDERLVDPSDYVRINIQESFDHASFSQFAEDVLNSRLLRLTQHLKTPSSAISDLLPSLTLDEEATLLGVHDRISGVKRRLLALAPHLTAQVSAFSDLETYFAYYRAGFDLDNLGTVIEEIEHASWSTNYGNYKYALLFTIRGKVRGQVKYYTGWSVFLMLSARNIRYLLELVVEALSLHIRDGQELGLPVSPQVQSDAALRVGEEKLRELDGHGPEGTELKKLVLSVGRIFGVLARRPDIGAPELVQFYIAETETAPKPVVVEMTRLLETGVMHLALLRPFGTKPTSEADTKAHDYMLHPILSPCFQISFRRKRKLGLSFVELHGLVHRPKETINLVLRRYRADETDQPLPSQLSLFRGFYDANS